MSSVIHLFLGTFILLKQVNVHNTQPPQGFAACWRRLRDPKGRKQKNPEPHFTQSSARRKKIPTEYRMHHSYLIHPSFPAPWCDDFGLRATPSDLHIYQAMDVRAFGGNLQGQLEAPVLTDWRVPRVPPRVPKPQSFQWRKHEKSEEIYERKKVWAPNPSNRSQLEKPTTRVYCCVAEKKLIYQKLSESPSPQPWFHPLRPSERVDLVDDSTGVMKYSDVRVVHLAHYIQWTSILKECRGRRLINWYHRIQSIGSCSLFSSRWRQWKVRTFSVTQYLTVKLPSVALNVRIQPEKIRKTDAKRLSSKLSFFCLLQSWLWAIFSAPSALGPPCDVVAASWRCPASPPATAWLSPGKSSKSKEGYQLCGVLSHAIDAMLCYQLLPSQFDSTRLQKPRTSSLTPSPTLIRDRSLWRLWDATLDGECTSVDGQLERWTDTWWMWLEVAKGNENLKWD